jgi:hypothetical protein
LKRYGSPLSERELQVLHRIRQVYGVRETWFDEKVGIISVEYDASPLTEQDIAALLRALAWTLASSPGQGHDNESGEQFRLSQLTANAAVMRRAREKKEPSPRSTQCSRVGGLLAEKPAMN